MADIKVTSTNIDGLFIIEPIIFSDNRGSLFESYNDDIFVAYGLDYKFVQDNESVTKKSVFCGIHVNIKHALAKHISVLDGEILDVVMTFAGI